MSGSAAGSPGRTWGEDRFAVLVQLLDERLVDGLVGDQTDRLQHPELVVQAHHRLGDLFEDVVGGLLHIVRDDHGGGQCGQRNLLVGALVQGGEQIEVAEDAVEQLGLLLRVPVDRVQVQFAALRELVGEVGEIGVAASASTVSMPPSQMSRMSCGLPDVSRPSSSPGWRCRPRRRRGGRRRPRRRWSPRSPRARCPPPVARPRRCRRGRPRRRPGRGARWRRPAALRGSRRRRRPGRPARPSGRASRRGPAGGAQRLAGQFRFECSRTGGRVGRSADIGCSAPRTDYGWGTSQQ